MNLMIDLRFVFPPLLNLILILTFGKSYWDGGAIAIAIAIEILQYPLSRLILLMLVILLSLILLSTAIILPLTANPIRLRPGNYSALLALAISASVMLPPSLFWFSYLFLIFISPCYGVMWTLFNHFFNWLRLTLQSFPTIFIFCSTPYQENPQLAAPQVEQDLQVVIDG